MTKPVTAVAVLILVDRAPGVLAEAYRPDQESGELTLFDEAESAWTQPVPMHSGAAG